MDNKEFESFVSDTDDFTKCTCNSGEANFNLDEDEGNNNYEEAIPLINDDLSNFDEMNFDGSCGCLEDNDDKCTNNNFGDFIGQVEVNDKCCGHHDDSCCGHGGCENKSCFKQDGNCKEDLFKPCKPKPKKAHLKVCKFVDKSEALDGEILRYCIKIENKGNATAFNIKLRDILPSGLVFVEGSLRVCGGHRCHKGTLNNLNLGSLRPCETIKIAFEARIACGTSGILRNFAEVTYCFATTRCGDIQCNSVRSNDAVTNVTTSPVSIVKTVDRDVVSVGEEIVYTVSVTNEGSVTVENFTLQDELPDILRCIEVSVGDTTFSCSELASGINIGSINAGETKDVNIRARVQDFPTDGTITNVAIGRFTRNGQQLCPVSSNTVSTSVVLFMCRPATVKDKIRVSCANGPVHTVTDAIANVKILDVKEERRCSGDGKYKRVRISGIINLCIKYDTCSGCEKKIVKKIPFCMTIKVPRSFVYNKNYCVTVEPKEICTKICCGFEIATAIKLIVCLTSI